jgi:flagellar biosynthesis protein FlhF
MRVKKVQGNSVKEAMKIATAMYGDEISLIETKSLKGGIFNKTKGWEVIVSLPEESEETSQENSRNRFQSRLENSYGGGLDLRIGDEQKSSKRNEKYSLLNDEVNESPKQRSKQQTNQDNNSNSNATGKNEVVDLSENAKKILEMTRQKKREANGQGVVKKNKTDGFPVHERTSRGGKVELGEENSSQILNEIKKLLHESQKENQREISKLNDKIKLIQNMFWEEKHPDETLSTTIPPEFSEIYKIARQSGMNRDHLEMIMKLSIENMPPKMKENSETVKRYFKAILRKMIPVRKEKLIEKPNKKVIMFVGSTGVGKTTTIAKLAARFTLEQKEHYKVGFLVLDTYKIGALEQLTQYAKMMKLQIDTVVSTADFGEKLENMIHNDYIFIDTMGSSPYDLDKINMLKEFLEQGNYVHEIEVTLVLPSSLKYEDLREGYESFSRLDIDTIIFTKLDETKGFGNIFSLVHDIQTPISYFSVGQEVPEDIVVAKSDFLVDSLLHGFKRNLDVNK